MKRPRRRHESTAYHESAHAVRSRVLGQMPGRSRAARTKERLDSRKATQESRSAKMGQPAMRELTSVVLEMERQGKRLYRMLRVGRLNTMSRRKFREMMAVVDRLGVNFTDFNSCTSALQVLDVVRAQGMRPQLQSEYYPSQRNIRRFRRGRRPLCEECGGVHRFRTAGRNNS